MKISEKAFAFSSRLSDLKCRLLLLTGFVVVFGSCEKTTNIHFVDSPATGKLNYTLVDDSGKGLSEVKVSIYRNDASFDVDFLEPRFLVDSLKTNADGTAIFSDLVPGDYKLIADSLMVNNVKYNSREMVQVVAGKEKKRVTKASEFTASLNITVISKADYRTPLKDIKVVATPFPLNSTAANIRSTINAAYFHGVSNAKGFVSLKIPSSIPYYLTAYNPYTNSISPSNEGYIIRKNGSYTLYFYGY